MNTTRTLFSIMAAAILALALSAGCDNNDPPDAVRDDLPAPALKIGLLLPPQSNPKGKSRRQAAEFARISINTADGDITFVEGDHTNNDTAVESVRDFIAKGVNGIVGPAASSRTNAIFDLLNQNKLVAVSPSATSVEFTKRNAALVEAGEPHYFFRTAPSDVYQAKLLENIAEGDVLIVYRDDNYGVNLKDLIVENMRANDRPAPKIVRSPEYDWTDSDAADKARAVVEDVESVDGIGDVDSIIMIVFEEGGRIIDYMLKSKAIPDGAQYIVTDGFAFKDLYTYVGEGVGEDRARVNNDPSKIEGFKGTTPYEHADPLERDIRFEHLFDRDTSIEFTTHTYDAVVTIALASLAAGSADPSVYVSEMENVTRGGTKCRTYAVCASLLNVGRDIDFQGLSGPIDFDRNGNITEGYYAVYTYDGKGCRTIEGFDFELQSVEVPEQPQLRRCAR